MTVVPDSHRVSAFRRGLIAAVPRFPNDKASLHAMQSKTLTDLLITYIGWRVRYVASRPRVVVGRERLAADPRSRALQENIDGFLRAVEAGDDLIPYMSLKPHNRGYTPAADPRSPKPDTWADKDFVLNVMGLHHFHLGLTQETAGHMARTDEALFAAVARDRFEVVGLFDHDAFEYEDNACMTPERDKLWSTYTQRLEAGLLPGQFAVGGFGGLGISLSSQPVAIVRAAQRHTTIIRDIDPKLDDRTYVASVYGGSPPSKAKLRWHYRHLDLGLYDEPAAFFGVFERGPN